MIWAFVRLCACGCTEVEIYLARILPYNISIFRRSPVRVKSSSAIFIAVLSSSFATQSFFLVASSSRNGRYFDRISASSSASVISRLRSKYAESGSSSICSRIAEVLFRSPPEVAGAELAAILEKGVEETVRWVDGVENRIV